MTLNDSFSPLIGQPQAIELLTQTVIQNRIAPAYLFVGSSGIGRSLAARCFIEFLFCHGSQKSLNPQQVRHRIQARNHPDLLWVEPTYLHQGKRFSVSEAEEAGIKRRSRPQIRLEQIREIGQFLSRPPLEASRLIVVLEQAETMAEAAANGLLKTLEEPGKATLILIAPGVDSLLSTLVSRCAKIPFYRLDEQAVAQVLKEQGQQEILSHPEIIAMSQGSPGEAMVCWQQLQAMSPEFLASVKQPPQTVYDALNLAKEISKTLDTEAQIWLIDYLQHCYWQQQQKTDLINPLFLQQLEKARQSLLRFVQPRLVWECTFLSFCQT
ncbi:DNA polymerase III, delta' subunit [Lyngbya aestuarii BL J]|uniref:DNA polymerase III, delta' subunit n=1 Tax=Lyngbya aestuarii BL J TaxID=1348334 RepID=U7QFY3_9CYAN|nr:DNA polymerase III subunit delta' [Lyngbya aestuarii]ERT06859.1 DNA polymerase III, delta' subunit [Lyngbya aestuarii BL J]